MQKIKTKLKSGKHILALPIAKVTHLETLFPKEITGSSIEKLYSDGTWSTKEIIYFSNNSFVISETYKLLEPFETIRLVLKRDIFIDWDISFQSHSGLKKSTINFEHGFDFNEALHLSQLSELVYEDKEKIEETLSKHYHFDTFDYYSKQSHKWLRDKGLIKLLLTFFTDKKSIIDLQFMHLSKRDAKTGKSLILIVFKGSHEPKDWLTGLSFSDDNFFKRGRVHKGFNQSLKLFFQTMKQKDLTATDLPLTVIEDIESINKNATIILTGHSLGGALATLAGCHLYEQGVKKENIEIYTFGAPPVGREDFYNYYNGKLNIYRIVNEKDVVPKLNQVTDFFHLGEEIVLSSDQGEIHCCEGYIDNIIDSISSWR